MMRAWMARNLGSITLVALSALFLIVLCWNRIVVDVPSGSVGVLWLRFLGGTVPNYYFSSGTKIIAPWDRIFLYDARLRNITERLDVITRDGLSATIGVTASYFVRRRTVGQLHEVFGPDYEKTLLAPVLAVEVRNAASNMDAEDLYRANVDKLGEKIAQSVVHGLTEEDRGVDAPDGLLNLTGVFIGPIVLPPKVVESIEAKLREQQEALRADYTIELERQESRRKVIEAEGIRQFQQIISAGISENYLRWKGIDATLQLARSNNAKVVVIGGGPGGLPLILDGADRTLAPTLERALKGDTQAAPGEPSPPLRPGLPAPPTP